MLKVLDPAVPVACWSCSVAHNESTLFCPQCSKIQPPPGSDYFSVFGSKPKLNLDLAFLEKEFHRLSRRLHPDRFARAAANGKNRRDGEMGASRVPADLLEEVFDLNMQLEEMRMAHKTGEEEDLGLKQNLTKARKKFESLRDAVDRDLRSQWNVWDEGDEAARHISQKAMVAVLDRRRYLTNLVRDVSETLDGKNGAGVFTQRGR